MNDPLQPARCAELLGALAAPERLKIVRFLSNGPKNVTEIGAMLKTPVVNVSHHLTVLKHSGLVNSQKQGRFVYYSLREGVLQADGSLATERLDLGCCCLELPAEQVAKAKAK